MTDSSVAERITNRRKTRANTSLVDSDIRDLGLSSGSRGKVLRTPPLRSLKHRVHSPALHELNPVPRVEISWVSDDRPDDTILERTIVPPESAFSVDLTDVSAHPQPCAQSPAESSVSGLIEGLVASLTSTTGVGPDRTVAESTIVPIQRTETPVHRSPQPPIVPETVPSISAAASAPVRFEPSSSPQSVSVSSSVVVSSVAGSAYPHPRDPFGVRSRREDAGPAEHASDWLSGGLSSYDTTSRACGPLFPRCFVQTRFPPPMSFAGGMDGDRCESGPSGTSSECPRNPRDSVEFMSVEQIAQKTSVIVKDLSTLMGRKRIPEIDNLVKSIASELTPIAHKRDYFRTLTARYHAIIDESRTNQAEADQRALEDLRRLADDFVAGTPLLSDGLLSYEGTASGPSGGSSAMRPLVAGSEPKNSCSGLCRE